MFLICGLAHAFILTTSCCLHDGEGQRFILGVLITGKTMQGILSFLLSSQAVKRITGKVGGSLTVLLSVHSLLIFYKNSSKIQIVILCHP